MVDLPPPELPAQPAPNAIQGTNAETAEPPTPPSAAPEPPTTSAEEADDTDAPKEKRRRLNFNSLEIAAQIYQVQEWLTSGLRPNAIRRLCEDEWGLTSRVAETRMASARQQMIADANVYDRKEKVGQMLQQLELVLQQALDLRQGSNAIGALRLQADLLQLLSRQN